MVDVAYWIWMSTFCHPGTKTSDLLLSKFESPEKLFHAEDDIIQALPLGETIKETILAHDMSEAKRIQSYCIQNNIGLLPYDCDLFPELLRSIDKKPILLYYRGALPDFNESLAIAMVGTRRCSEYGRRNAYTLSYDLARAGVVVVSGMALGIDTCVHRGALDAGGKTVAFLGGGVDTIYPIENKELYDNLAHFGTVMSEFKPGTSPLGRNFPIRNRLISGIARGSIIVEADLKSGAMITARTADAQGRDVFSLPGEVGESNSRGTNSLLRDGAKIVLKVHDILNYYEKDYRRVLTPNRIGEYMPQTHRGFSKAAPPPNQSEEEAFALREELFSELSDLSDPSDHSDPASSKRGQTSEQAPPLAQPTQEENKLGMVASPRDSFKGEPKSGSKRSLSFDPIEYDENMNIVIRDPASKSAPKTGQAPVSSGRENKVPPSDGKKPIAEQKKRRPNEPLMYDPYSEEAQRNAKAFMPYELSKKTPQKNTSKKKTKAEYLLAETKQPKQEPLPRPDPSELSEFESVVYNLLQYNVDYQVESFYDLLDKEIVSFSKLVGTISMLEIKNFIQMRPGGFFYKV